MLKQVKAEREAEDFNGILKQIKIDIKILKQKSMEARKEIEAEIILAKDSDGKRILKCINRYVLLFEYSTKRRQYLL